jgi:hypothetical protein
MSVTPARISGYLCANVWRFGGDRPVGGFGTYRELLDGYRSVRDRVPDADELHRWQLYAALGWGLVCLTMLELHTSGVDPGLERAAVGRRLGESEIDILLLLDEVTRCTGHHPPQYSSRPSLRDGCAMIYSRN